LFASVHITEREFAYNVQSRVCSAHFGASAVIIIAESLTKSPNETFALLSLGSAP